mgnify:CR=1 FL=1
MSDPLDASPKSSVSSTKREDTGEREIRCYYEIRVSRRLPLSSTLRAAEEALGECRASALAEMARLVGKSQGDRS